MNINPQLNTQKNLILQDNNLYKIGDTQEDQVLFDEIANEIEMVIKEIGNQYKFYILVG